MSTSPRIEEPIHPDLISREQAAVMIGCSAAHIAKTRPFHEYRLGAHFVRLDRVEVETYVRNRTGK